MNDLFGVVLGLVALDERDDAVLEALAALAAAGQADRILLLHVQERTRRFGIGALLPAVGSPAGGAEPSPALAACVSRLATAAPGARVVGLHAAGRAIEEVTRVVEREQVDLVVVGRSTSPTGGSGWGEHGLRVLRLSDAPVLVVPLGCVPRLGRILVGMDLSECSFDALAAAMRLGASVRALAVVDRAAEGLDDSAFFELQRSLQAQYEELGSKRGLGPLPPLSIVEEPNPGDAMLGWAEPAGDDGAGMVRPDMVIVGSRGLTPVAAVLLGSTAETLGGRSDLPLLVWRRKGRQRGLLSALFG